MSNLCYNFLFLHLCPTNLLETVHFNDLSRSQTNSDINKKDLGHSIDGADVTVLPRADFFFLLHKKYMSHSCHLRTHLYLCKPSYFRIQCGQNRVNYINTISQARSFTGKATWHANLRACTYIKISQSWDMFGMAQNHTQCWCGLNVCPSETHTLEHKWQGDGYNV